MNFYYFTQVTEDTARLEGEEARHCVKVLRKKRNDDVLGIDGKGNQYLGRITDMGKGWVELILVEKNTGFGEHPYHIEVALSPLRLPDRFEWFLEKGVELGCTHISHVITTHTVKPNLRMARLERIMIAALKQCMRSQLPHLADPQRLIVCLDLARREYPAPAP